MKKILVFSNREQIGDGIIKLPFIYELKIRFPNSKIIWATNSGKTVYNNLIKNIASQYIDEFYETVPLLSFLLRRKNTNYNLNQKFDIVIDTQKAVIRSLAIRFLKSDIFISSAANWIFSDVKPEKKINKLKDNYYLNDLFFMLDLISQKKEKNNFVLNIPNKLQNEVNKLFNKDSKYFAYSPGSATKERIWKIENFIQVAIHFSNLNFIPTFFLGPLEKDLKDFISRKIPNAFFPEDEIKSFSGPEVVMAASKNIECSLANDSGTSHMLSIGTKYLVKIIGPSSSKFTSKKENFHIIDSNDFGTKNVNIIKPDFVINYIEKNILKKN